jgi:N-acetylmuramoyl-L-alanine amidase
MKRIGVLVAIILAAGCRTTPPEPPIAEKPTQPIHELPVAVDTGDLSSLHGRRICLDPGHGGPWPGAVAPSNSIREADVNLNVARRLQRMLEQAGATVIMTRVDDTVPQPANLSADLAARAAIANQNQVDAFLSIHHNADIDTGSDRNDLEVYYKLREEGASLDLAQALTRSLARELGATATARRLLPGNYKVLRQAEVPAVLLESSYMTHAANASALASEQTLTAEANAIAVGLANYFALDPPLLASSELATLDNGRTHELRVRFARGMPIDMTTVHVRLDGAPAPGVAEPAEGGFVWTFPHTLPNGPQDIQVTLRNAKGAALEFPANAVVNRPATSIALTQTPERIAARSGCEILVQAHVHDALGFSVADGATVALEQTGDTATTTNGIARFYIAEPEKTPTLTVSCGTTCESIALTFGDARYRSLRVVRTDTTLPIGGAAVAANGTTLGVTTPEGWYAAPVTVNEVYIRRPGYEPAFVKLGKARADVPLTPIANGAIIGKTIVLDPAYGGREAGAIGPEGMRASDYALGVARRTAALLRAAGATVHISRPGDLETSEPQRVLVAEDTGADILVSISLGSRGANARTLDASGHRADRAAFVGHYPNSPDGTRLAKVIGDALGGLPAVPSVTYVVQQTGCPAVLVQPADITEAGNESRYRSPEVQRMVADGIYRGILAFYGSVKGP